MQWKNARSVLLLRGGNVKLNVGETVVIRNLKTLLDGAKDQNGRRYLNQRLNQAADIYGFMYAEVYKVSARKYQLTFVVTDENSYNVEDDEIYFTAGWYNIKILNDVREVEYDNEFFGKTLELGITAETTCGA